MKKNKKILKHRKTEYNYKFKNKVVLVTGASKGLGYQIAKSYLKHGSNLMICSSNLTNIKKSYINKEKQKLKNQKIFYLVADVSSPKQVKKLVNFTIKKFNQFFYLFW
jgi:NAD(P)-dependent dehydrogenase (short-subunit alcohol dehydrogenase family)